jgi:hypothetical protein
MREVVKKEVLKLLHAGIIYPMQDREWVSPVQVVPNKGGDRDVGSQSSVRFWITLVVGGARHTDPASDPKTRIQQS